MLYPGPMPLKRIISEGNSDMPTTLDVKPVDQSAQPAGRMPLDKLSALGADRITAAYARALPAEEAGQVAVAAFNSSI